MLIVTTIVNSIVLKMKAGQWMDMYAYEKYDVIGWGGQSASLENGSIDGSIKVWLLCFI